MGDHLRRRRLELGLAQRTLALRLGVREETVRLWESGRSRPLPRHYGRIVRFLGYDPAEDGASPGGRLRALRRRLGLTQVEMARQLGVDEGTVVDLEGGRRAVSRRVLGLVAKFLEEHEPGRGASRR
jgi:transcriptional regulator with XRE-family HTH domain